MPGSPAGSVVKKLPVVQELQEARIRSLGGEHGKLLQYPCLDNPRDREAWWATVRGVPKSWTRLKLLSIHISIPISRKIRHKVFAYVRLEA